MVRAARMVSAADVVSRAVERRLGGYRQPFVRANPSDPKTLPRPLHVGIIGGGLAGIVSALSLAERGARVTLFESEAHLGGKLGGWREDFVDPESGENVSLPIDHGFHAYFPHYYNMNDWLARLGITNLAPIGEYRILQRDRTALSFNDSGKAPGLNVLGLAEQGLFGLSHVIPPRGRMMLMERFFRYHPRRTFRDYDHVSFATFIEQARLPKAIALVFQTFSRAFFAEPDRMSLAELMKAFHFYYLSHDRGLIYDYLKEGYASGLIAPLWKELNRLGVSVRLSTRVESLERSGKGFRVGEVEVDDVILAAPSVVARDILMKSEFARREAPEFIAQIRHTPNGQRYAVLRLFADRRIDGGGPVFIATERVRLLDSITFLHRVDAELDAWAGPARGVYELHSYAVPDDVRAEDVAGLLKREFEHFYPELAGMKSVHEHLQLKNDFSAYHVGLHANRASTVTPLRGLLLAGDWVKLPIPAMLLEAACVSGLLAANVLFEREGVALENIDTVPLRGLLSRR